MMKRNLPKWAQELGSKLRDEIDASHEEIPTEFLVLITRLQGAAQRQRVQKDWRGRHSSRWCGRHSSSRDDSRARKHPH